MLLDWLGAFLNDFDARKAGLRAAQQELQKQSKGKDQSVFDSSAAMSTIMARLSRPVGDEERQCFIDNIKVALKTLEASRTGMRKQQALETQSELPPSESTTPTSSL